MVDELSIRAAARDAPNSPGLIADGRTWTFEALAQFAAGIIARVESASAGANENGQILLRCANDPATLATILALIDRGTSFVPMHPRWTEAERQVVASDWPSARWIVSSDVQSSAAAEDPVGSAPPPTTMEAPLAVVYTSGTTGRPKGAVLSRRAFVASAVGSGANLSWRRDDRWLLCMPLCHIGGLSVLTRCLAARKCVVLHSKFDADEALDSIVNDGVTLMSVVPTMLRRLLAADRHNVLSRARAILVGGAAAPESLMRACAERNIAALTTYGLTEACSQVTVQSPRDARQFEPGVGRALPGVRVDVVDALGHSVNAGVAGEIRVGGATLMSGYWRGESVPPAGCDTGDHGVLDGVGRLEVCGRRSDLIVSGGENVYPLEVERALECCPGVQSAAVFGTEDAEWDHVVSAALVVDVPAEQVERMLADALRERLARFKWPRRLAFVSELPLSADGKPDRARLARDAASQLTPWAPER